MLLIEKIAQTFIRIHCFKIVILFVKREKSIIERSHCSHRWKQRIRLSCIMDEGMNQSSKSMYVA